MTVENVTVWSTRRGLRIKTAAGRGGFVRDITYRNVTFEDVRVGIVIRTDYNEHPDKNFDPLAFPELSNITYIGIRGRRVEAPVTILGTKEMPVKGMTFQDVEIEMVRKREDAFVCSFVEGRAVGSVSPEPCSSLERVP